MFTDPKIGPQMATGQRGSQIVQCDPKMGLGQRESQTVLNDPKMGPKMEVG